MKSINRRMFLKSTAGLLALAGLDLTHLNAASLEEPLPVPRAPLGANERINVAIIGLGGRSSAHLAEYGLQNNCRITHVCDPDTAKAQPAIDRAGKRDGLNVTAEASPHHLLLTDESCRHYDANYKMNPPLRTVADVKACIEGVKDGTIDCLATDHAPHLREENELEFQYAPFGILWLLISDHRPLATDN